MKMSWKKRIVLLPLCLSTAAAAQNAALENGALVFTGDTAEQTRKGSPEPKYDQAERAEVFNFKVIPGEGFQFSVSAPCEAAATLHGAGAADGTLLFRGGLRAGTHRILWKKVRVLPAGEYRLTFQLGPVLRQDRSFGRNGFVRFGNPSKVCVLNDRIYVQDNETIRNKTFSVVRTLNRGGNEMREFLKGCSLGDMGKDGTLYAVRGTRIEAYSPGGKLLFKRNSPGGALAAGGGRLFLRSGGGHNIYAAETGDAEFKKQNPFSAKTFPVHTKVSSPCMAADENGALYLADCGSSGQCFGALNKAVFENGKLRNAYHCPSRFKDLLSPVPGKRNQVYALERGTVAKASGNWQTGAPALLEFFDSGSSLVLSGRMELPPLAGVRSLAVSGRRFYILEDSEDYRGVKGKGRLSCFELSFTKEQTIAFTL